MSKVFDDLLKASKAAHDAKVATAAHKAEVQAMLVEAESEDAKADAAILSTDSDILHALQKIGPVIAPLETAGTSLYTIYTVGADGTYVVETAHGIDTEIPEDGQLAS